MHILPVDQYCTLVNLGTKSNQDMHDRTHAAAAGRGFLENGTVANHVAPDLQQINGAATPVVDILI